MSERLIYCSYHDLTNLLLERLPLSRDKDLSRDLLRLSLKDSLPLSLKYWKKIDLYFIHSFICFSFAPLFQNHSIDLFFPSFCSFSFSFLPLPSTSTMSHPTIHSSFIFFLCSFPTASPWPSCTREGPEDEVALVPSFHSSFFYPSLLLSLIPENSNII